LTFSVAEVTALATTQTAWMQDACQIGVYTSGVDSAGGPTSTYTLGSEIACGVDTASRSQGRFYDSDGTYYYADAVIRLPLGTVITFADHVTVTKRMGVAVTNVEYSLMRVPAVGVSCITCMCRQVVT
jgi:phage-related minor tail protein